MMRHEVDFRPGVDSPKGCLQVASGSHLQDLVHWRLLDSGCAVEAITSGLMSARSPDDRRASGWFLPYPPY